MTVNVNQILNVLTARVKDILNNIKNPKQKSVREILLWGVFWRILFIEGVLLVCSLGYKWVTEDATSMDLFWYSVRITVVVVIIIAFMMVTLKRFLAQNIIAPLEAIASSNKQIQADISIVDHIDLPENSPHEIATIVTTRSKMLKTILNISEERLKYSKALNDELERGKKIQNDFLPRHLPKIKNCDIASYFHSALQLSGDFYDVFELPDHHVGFVVGDVSGKGVGSALFMALTRSLLRIFSGSFDDGNNSCRLADSLNGWTPEDALKTVFLTNEYLAKEHGEDGMFVTLFFGVIDPLTGKISYVNGGHEPLFIIGENGIKQSLTGTGPALGPIQGASYDIKTIQLETGDMLFSYTDGITEARSETKKFYTRARLEDLMNIHFTRSAENFLETIKTDLFTFIGDAPQSDDITMLAIKWQP
ncbi:PP2C family protein-serine/threonine phosphatase [Desulfobacula sp.]|uniref:PP2C family protein-serine/threonine phosphatase n=1 Tax=Desulfobacula sp. TaxID=2593537 RepID=UPI00260E86BE|nr:PP2C family protein-serine/threonine phosphatase [Desulfobacula sp.]